MKRVLGPLALLATLLSLAATLAFADDTPTYQEALASRENGGTLTSEDGKVVWTVQGAAYGENFRMRYTPGNAGAFQLSRAGAIFVGNPFTLQAVTWDSREPTDTDYTTTVTVRYDPADLGGRDESSLRLALRGSEDGTNWKDQPSTIDTTNHVVTGNVPQSGDYALISDPGSPGGTVAAPPAPAPQAAPAAASAAPASANPAPGASGPMSSAITGRVFYDRNGNGTMDGQDYPIVGAGLRLTSGSWSTITMTDASGDYAFGGLGVGTYTVTSVLVASPDWAYSNGNVASDIALTGQPDSSARAEFGMHVK